MEHEALRGALLAAARRLHESGLNRGTAGNVSVRLPGGDGSGPGFLITPSGMAYGAMQAGDMVAMGLDGSFARGRPSSEWRIHRDIYVSRPQAGAVVHTHSMFATVLSCMECAVPAFHYMVARFGGADLRCAAYATFGSAELSEHALQALAGRNACLLAHHGAVAAGGDLEQAVSLAFELEEICEQYWRLLQMGAPRILPDDEMARVLEKFRSYGRS